MGKLKEFDITFTNNKVVYSPGESISGSVKITTGTSLQYKAIKVNCLGSCGVSNKMNDMSWTLEEQYFSSTLSVADKGILAAGEHSFPFQFLIPVAAPTSFEGPFGKIVYRVRAVIDTPRFSKDYKAQRPFYLLNLLNLNQVPNIEQPSYAVTTKRFSYLLVKTGTLMMKACSDQRGYTPGQIIRLATEIHNKSGKDTGCVLASLIQVSLKSPETVVTLPIYIGNIAVNLIPSRPMPSTPAPTTISPNPGPEGVTPSAPPAEEDLEEVLGAGGSVNEEIPTKSHSQQDQSGQPPTMSPSAFSYTPGVDFPPSQRHANDTSTPLFCVSTGATIPFFTEGNATPVPTSCPLILPPEYSTWDFTHEPPPTYEESCSSNNSSFNNSRPQE
ncbi:arrestin domain-containing protein 1 isoform X2 [Oncorhynchus mykiss]|uniref:arrestin domain-containing protein 1 isoform X2 n=1 Tax=Oncorhynchus mykiss TaxID=8022 RepID=UPI001877D974|nr:arrestin domain-containing protein 1 isoform X2 [Oncorhynchus mykiss]